MTDQAPHNATIHTLDPDVVLHIRDRLAHSATLIHGWLESLEAGGSEDALIGPANLLDVIKGLAESLSGFAESLPDQHLPEVLSEMLIARSAELEFTVLAIEHIDITRGDPAWFDLLLAWVRAADKSVHVCSVLAQDIAKRMRGPRLRRALADENNSTLINAIAFYRTDPRTGKVRSARAIAGLLRRSPGFDPFTERRSEEALTRLVQRILRKS